MPDDLIKATVAIVKIDDLAIDVRGANLFNAPLLQLELGGVADQSRDPCIQGLELRHYFFERFLIFHTISILYFERNFKPIPSPRVW